MAKNKKTTIKRLDISELKIRRKPFKIKEFLRMAKGLKEAVRKEQEGYARFQPA